MVPTMGNHHFCTTIWGICFSRITKQANLSWLASRAIQGSLHHYFIFSGGSNNANGWWIWGILFFGANVGKYTIHWACAIDIPRMILVAGVTYSYSADDFGESDLLMEGTYQLEVGLQSIASFIGVTVDERNVVWTINLEICFRDVSKNVWTGQHTLYYIHLSCLCFTFMNLLLFNITLYRPNGRYGIIIVIYSSILFHFYTFGRVMFCLCSEVVVVCKIILDIQVSRR